MPYAPRSPAFPLFLLTAILLVPAGAHSFPAQGTAEPESPGSPASGSIRGTVAYQPDSEQPWRYARYYVNKEGRLAEAVVVLTRTSGARIRTPSSPEHESVTYEMGQKDFRFVPETLVIRRGDRVRFTNEDLQLHNVRTSDLLPFNVNTPPEGDGHVQLFPKAGGVRRPVRLGCVFHSNMQAWIYVFDHPFHALTAADGTFHLENVPPGKYRLTVVHPSGRLAQSTELKVTAGAETRSSVTLTPDDLTTRKGKS